MANQRYSERKLAQLKDRINKMPESASVGYIAKRLGIGRELVTCLRNGSVEIYRECNRRKREAYMGTRGQTIVRDAHYSRCPDCGRRVQRPCRYCDVSEARYVLPAETTDEGTPTQSEIKAACEAIQATWDDTERAKRAGMIVDAVEIELVNWVGE